MKNKKNNNKTKSNLKKTTKKSKVYNKVNAEFKNKRVNNINNSKNKNKNNNNINNSKNKNKVEESKFNKTDSIDTQYKIKNKIGSKLLLLLLFGLLLVVGVSFAISAYMEIGNNSKLITGDIYLDYKTTDVLYLSNTLPRSTLDENHYIQFTVSGLNEYREDIVYSIDLVYGDGVDGKNVRISDDLLRFTLMEKVGNGEFETILDGVGYESINNQRIWFQRIQARTLQKITYTYRLYAWITDDILIGNLEEANYSEEEWNSLFASIKVKVTGDFEEKNINQSIKVNFDADGGHVSKLFKYYNNGDMYGELPVPVKEGYTFGGWTYKNQIVKSTDYVTDSENTFVSDEDLVFDGTNYIDTGMYVFSQDNWARNFYLTFKVKSNNSITNQATLINAKLENESRGYPGFLFRCSSNNCPSFDISANTDSTNSRRINGIPRSLEKVTFVRLNKMLYYAIDDNELTEVLNFNGFSNYFNVPLTIGASLDSNGAPFRYFVGTISDFKALYLDDSATINNYLDHITYSSDNGITLKAIWIRDNAQYSGEYVFNGSNYIDTGIYLFSQENWQKNFYMSFEILENNSTDTMATPMSAKNESGTPWPGFELRLAGNKNYYRSKASKSSTSSKDVTNIPVGTTRKVQYLRINNILYYNIDSMTNGKFVKMLDFSGFNLYFDIPVTFGASLKGPNGIPQRYFIGKLANMRVNFINDSDLPQYQAMLSS